MGLGHVLTISPALDGLHYYRLSVANLVEFFFLDITTSLLLSVKGTKVINHLSHWFAGKILRVR